MARQGYGNARFEVDSDEGLDVVEELYVDEGKQQSYAQTHDLKWGEDIRDGLQQSVRALN